MSSDSRTSGDFSKQDNLVYLKLRRWGKRRTGNAKKAHRLYWRAIGIYQKLRYFNLDEVDDEDFPSRMPYSRAIALVVRSIQYVLPMLFITIKSMKIRL